MHRYSTRLQARRKAAAQALDRNCAEACDYAFVKQTLAEINRAPKLKKVQLCVTLFAFISTHPTVLRKMHTHRTPSILLDRIQYLRAQHKAAEQEFKSLAKVYSSLSKLRSMNAKDELCLQLRTDLDEVIARLLEFERLEVELRKVESGVQSM